MSLKNPNIHGYLVIQKQSVHHIRALEDGFLFSILCNTLVQGSFLRCVMDCCVTVEYKADVRYIFLSYLIYTHIIVFLKT